MWCCARRPPPPPSLCSLPDLPALARESNNVSAASVKKEPNEALTDKYIISLPKTDIDVPDYVDEPALPPRSPSIKVEDYSEKSACEPDSSPASPGKSAQENKTDTESQKSPATESLKTIDTDSQKSTTEELKVDSFEAKDDDEMAEDTPADPVSRAGSPDANDSRSASPESLAPVVKPRPDTRDVRRELAASALPPQHERWEQVVDGLAATARLAADPRAAAPAAAWRAAARAAAAHVRSLRSRVAREAAGAVGALFQHRGAVLEPELEDTAAALLDRCADVNRFLRADAAEALAQVACGSGSARAAAALARRGAAHRAGAARAAAAASLARLAAAHGTARLLAAGEARALLLRAAGELLADAHPDSRRHARALCCHLAKDARFPRLLRDAMPPSRYRAIEKLVDKIVAP